MSKLECAIAAAVMVYFAVACVGIYATWRDCAAVGGTIVRGLFGLECIK